MGGKCLVCGLVWRYGRRDRKFCGDRCRQTAHRKPPAEVKPKGKKRARSKRRKGR